VHEFCAIWCRGVTEKDGKLYGVSKALTRSMGKLCEICQKNGAGCCCYHSNCTKHYHIKCLKDKAKTTDFEVNFETKEIYCEEHSAIDHNADT